MAADGYDSALGVSRRALDMEDYVDILRRQKAWIIGPTFAALVIAFVVAFLWPDTYISIATVRVVAPLVPESLVPTNVNQDLGSRINSMAQSILSRSNLTNIINVHNLYERERNRLPMEDVVENMKARDIRISQMMNVTPGEGKRQVPAFQISFNYENRAAAQKVCQELVSKFIAENQRERANTSTQTTQFLKDQLEQRRRELEVVEDKLAQFRINNKGKLSDQVGQNMQQLNAMEQRLSNLSTNISRINQEKLLTDAQIRIYRDQMNKLGTGEVEVGPQVKEQAKNERIARLDNEIMIAETRLAALKEQYKDTHPDVQTQSHTLTVLRKQKEETEKQEAKKPAPTPEKRQTYTDAKIVQARNELDSTIRRLQSSMEAKDLELDEAKRDAQRIDALIKTTQGRLDITPLSEKEYVDLQRERDLVRQQVEDLNRKQSMSKISEDLEKRQQSETLEMLDPASLPQKPAFPDRRMIIGMGTAIGLAFGLFFSIGRELKDTSLKNLKDVRAYTQLQILGSIPLLENDLVVRRRRRLGMLAWSTAVILGCVIMGGSVYYYLHFVTKA